VTGPCRWRQHQQYLVAGTPAQCIARIRQFQQAGAESVMLNLACPPDGRDQMLTMVAGELLPALHG
jgi:alkanesulfonate monooxygenase SsuD/methylene tetrahydromethanopterin reductase-like flavin-dependent oxidoreductase (luciferase family)